MKLLIVLSVIACGYAAKLDRTYLPPASASTAGGSPGSLNAPFGAGPSTFGQAPGSSGYGRSSSAFGMPPSASDSQNTGFVAPSNQYGQPVGSNFDAGFGRPAQNFRDQQAQDYQRSQPTRAQATAEQASEILRLDNQNDGESFSYNFETSNGIAAEESGVATNGVQAQGAFSYSDDDGQAFRVAYTADENGYHPQGDHLPTPHPIPEEILKSIEKNAQAAASGTQEGAYNPDEDDSASVSQQYTNNARTSYSQAPSAGYNYEQPQGPAASGPASRPQARAQGFQPQGPSLGFQSQGSSQAFQPQGPSQGFQPQGSSQQLGTSSSGVSSARPGNGFSKSLAPSQQYGSPSNGPANNGPDRQIQSQGASGFAPSRATGSGVNGFGPASSIAPNGFGSSQPKPKSYQAQPGSFNAISQRPAQAQDESGYQYNRPQGGSSFGQGSVGQYRPQNEAQGSFPSSQGSFGSSGPRSQGSFGASRPSGQGAFGPSSDPKGPSFGTTGTTSPGQGAFASTGPAGQSSFGPASGSQSSFGSSSGSNGFSRPQGSFQSGAGSMPDSGYQYNRPATQSGGSQPQSGFNGGFNGGSQGRPGQTFGGPRQPPSFSEEEGYKY